MLDSLQIVRGAVSKERLIPVLSHFAFKGGRVCGFDGRVYINAPAPDAASLDVTVPARPFLTAYDAMRERAEQSEGALEVRLTHVAEENKVRVNCGRFRVTLPAGRTDAFPFMDSVGQKKRVKVGGGLLDVLALLRPFVGEDASRPWSASVRVCGAVAFATNNVALAAAGMPENWPLTDVVLPVQAVDELLRIGLEPTHVVVDAQSCTFYLPGDVWLRTALIAAPWPDAAGTLKAAFAGARLRAAPTARWVQAVEAVRPFCPDAKHEVVVLEGRTIKTLEGETSAEMEEEARFPTRCSFHIDPLLSVLRVATHLDLSRYPRVAWRGRGVEGMLLGMG